MTSARAALSGSERQTLSGRGHPPTTAFQPVSPPVWGLDLTWDCV
jgi:hypothetical protein